MAAPRPPTVQDLMSALEPLTDPLTGASWVADKAIRNLQVQGDSVSLELELGYPAQSRHEALRQLLQQAALAVPGVARVEVKISTRVLAHAVQGGVQLLPQVRNIVAVASGQGGLGKSTKVANLAPVLYTHLPSPPNRESDIDVCVCDLNKTTTLQISIVEQR